MEKYDFGLSDLFGEGSNKLTATITIKADVNGTVSIDGSYVASIKTSEPIQTECGMGQHIIKVKTEKHPDIFKETILDIDTPGRNYLVIIDGLSSLVAKAEKVSTGFSSKGIFMLFAKRKKVAPVAVDMGLSVKWANANLGADNPEGYGDYYAWGEKKTKKDYSKKMYKAWWDWDTDDCVMVKSHDVAHKILGGGWRIPTKGECRELIDHCTWTWTKQNGVEGMLATSKRNGNSIFFPAAGRRIGSNLCRAHFEGYYWTSCRYSMGDAAICIRIDSERELYPVEIRDDDHVHGLTVRPVKE